MQEQEKANGESVANEQVTPQAAASDANVHHETVSESSNVGADTDSAQEKLISELQAKVTELQDAFLRAKADGENIRRRAQDDISKAHKFAIESFAEAMVPVKDSLEMALKVETLSVEALKEGVEVTLRQLTSAFEKNRLLEVNPAQGEKLDPTRHQAISMVEANQEANTVVAVLQKGYTISDRLLRPALVTVAQSK